MFMVTASSSQVTTGAQLFGSFGGGPFDRVNLGNLNVHFSIPVVHKAGRGMPFTYDLSYDSSIWSPVDPSTGNSGWTPVLNWGWRGVTEVTTGYVSFQTVQTSVPNCPTGSMDTTYSHYVYHDPLGASHSFPGKAVWRLIAGSGCSDFWHPLTAIASDGSGYTVYVTSSESGTGNLTSRTGKVINPPFNDTVGAGNATDANGNQITVNNSGQFFDTLSGTTPVLTVSGTAPNPTTYTYTSPSGSKKYTMNYGSYSVHTNFGCGIPEYTATAYLVSSIVLPDNSQYTFTYEISGGSYTGRLASVELPTGGTISYTYTAAHDAHDGIVCADGSTIGLSRTTPDSSTPWTYVRSGSDPTWTTTVTDPLANETVLDFQKDSAIPYPNYNFYETQRVVKQGSNTLSTTITCYNSNNIGTPSSCPSTAVTSPIKRTTVFRYLPTSSGSQAETDTTYDSTGHGLVNEVDDYDYGNAAVGPLIRKTITNYGSGSTCVGLGNGIVDRPCTVTIEDSGNHTKAQTTYTYDEVATTPSGATQHCLFGQLGCPPTGSSRGNLTTLAAQANSTTTLYRKFTYFDTGILKTSTDVSTSNTTNGALTTYTYGSSPTSCDFAFPTSISEPLSLSRSMTWDCNGGVLLSLTDESNNTSSTAYSGTDYTNDFWRPYSTTDQAGNITKFTYPIATQTETKLSFNSSVVDHLTTVDGLGRLSVSQTQQGPGGNYDSVETSYDALGRVSIVTLPYAASSGGACSGTCPATSYGYDTMNRVTSVTDSGGGSISSVYTNNDVLQTVASPSRQKQLEYDGLGRLKSVCELTAGTTAWPNGTCAQKNNQTGYWTTYAYDELGGLKGVTQNAQSATKQTRAYVYDMLGRLTSEANPETSNVATTYTYDTDTTCTGGYPAGNLVKRVDPANNTTCYSDDQLHRALNVTYPNSASDARHFVYDSATVNGQAMANAKGRLAEAWTCSGACTSAKTVLGFSYSARGEVTDAYESTPNSGGFYHVIQSYLPNGAVNTVSGLTGVPTITYGVDGEGRVSTVSASGQNPVTATVYNSGSDSTNPVGALTKVTYGSGDFDQFSYDTNTGRMTGYTLNVGSQNYAGTVGWNSNGTVQSLNTVDGITGGNPNSSVTYTYDDIGRLSKASDGVNLDQTFSYDPFGNINTTGNPVWWTQTYVATNNQYQASGMCPNSGSVCYDANGNLRSDSFHIYTWDAENKLTSIDTGLTGGPVVTDAFGRVVESTISGVTQQILYGPTAKLGFVNGQTMTKIRIPLPGGGQAIYNAGALAKYNHPDWLGNIRVGSKAASQTLSGVSEYTPFGMPYDNGTVGPAGPSFNGSFGDVLDSHEYDATNRELHPVQGRWIQPDPAGISAADPTNPQSWNRYAYVVNNPLSFTDPTGMDLMACDWNFGADCGGGGGGPWYCPPEFGNCDPGCDPFFGCGGGGGPGGGGPGGGGPGGGGPGKGGSGGPSGPQTSRWANGETPGLPQLPTQPLSLGDLLGLTPGCDFELCNPIGNGFEDTATLGAALPICVAQPELCVAAGVIGIGIIVYGPQIIKTVKDTVDWTSQFSKCLHQFIEDVKACNDAYPPGPAREECHKKAKQKFDLCKAGGTIQ